MQPQCVIWIMDALSSVYFSSGTACDRFIATAPDLFISLYAGRIFSVWFKPKVIPCCYCLASSKH